MRPIGTHHMTRPSQKNPNPSIAVPGVHAPPTPASWRPRGRRAAPGAIDSLMSTARRRVRRTRGGLTDRVSVHTRPVAGARVRLPFVSGDLLEDVDLELAIRDHLLQPRILLLDRAAATASRRPAPACQTACATCKWSGRSPRAFSRSPAPAADRPHGGWSPSALR